MNVLVIEPGHGSVWLAHAVFVDKHGQSNPRGRFIEGLTWVYDGGWNMPDDYQGQYEPYGAPRRYILKVELTDD